MYARLQLVDPRRVTALLHEALFMAAVNGMVI
jgi:hypothetical protein